MNHFSSLCFGCFGWCLGVDIYFSNLTGTDTTSAFIEWAILYMVSNPEIQEKVHEEIKDSIGLERLPNLQDKEKLPYTMATLEEIMRLNPQIVFTLPHYVMQGNDT